MYSNFNNVSNAGFGMPALAIALLWIGAVVDPIGDMFAIRYVSIGLATVTVIFVIVASPASQINFSCRAMLICFISIIFPIYGLVLYAIHRSGGDFIDTSYIAAGLLMVFSLLYKNKYECIFGVKSLIFASRLLAILTIFTYAMQILSFNDVIGFFTTRNVALVGERQYGGIKFPYIYFVASPILIFLLAYDFHKLRNNFKLKTVLMYIFSSIALFLSGTRAHMLISITFPLMYLALISDKSVFLRFVAILNVFVIISIFSVEVREFLISLFLPEEENNSLKLLLLFQYQEIFSDPIVILFGQGFNAHEWSPIFRSMVTTMEFDASKTELTYIELYRVFGIFIATSFLVLIFYFVSEIKKLPEEFRWIYPALVIYLVGAAVNPYFFSVNGILPIGLFSAVLLLFGQGQLRKGA